MDGLPGRRDSFWTLIEKADLVIVRFGDQYRQWNAAFDAGYASALGKPLIVIHPEEFTHALNEVDSAANAVAENTSQVIRALEYITTQERWCTGIFINTSGLNIPQV